MPPSREIRRAAKRLLSLADRLEKSRAIRMSDFWFLHGVAAAETADRLAAGASVDSLGLALGSHEQLASMRDGEFATVVDVATGSIPRLSRVPGVQPRFARVARSAAREVRARLVASTAPRFTPAERTSTQSALLSIVSRRVLTDRATHDLRDNAVDFARAARRLIPASRAAANPVARALAGRRGAQKSAKAIARLEELVSPHLESGLASSIASRLKEANVRTLRDEALWDDFGRHPDEYYAVLEDITGGPRRAARTYGPIPGHLVAAAVAMPFDLSPFRSSLLPYQEFGARFATYQGRLILGDDDGLGRTVQAIAVMAHLSSRGTARVLVLAPPSRHEHWQRAIRRHSGLHTLLAAGAAKEAAMTEWRAVGGVAIATDDVLGPTGTFRASDIALLVVDQAHHVAAAPPAASERVAELANRADRVLLPHGAFHRGGARRNRGPRSSRARGPRVVSSRDRRPRGR